jgi:hypothetical protein
MILTLAFLTLFAIDQPAFLKTIQAGDAVAVRKALDDDPSLANAHTQKGVSAVIVAMFINKGEGFLEPKSNEALQAVLARHPKFDVFDTAAFGTRDQLEAMLKTTPVNARSSFGWTLLHIAAFAGNAPNTELLIARGADISDRATSKFRNTPLQTAVLNGQYETAKILVDHGADVLVRQSRGFTPLHEAALLGRQDLVQLLIDHGAELNSRSDSGRTPLSEAIRGKHDDVAAWLKAKGAMVEEDKSDD